jgi:DNA-binding NtrC family response regulator
MGDERPVILLVEDEPDAMAVLHETLTAVSGVAVDFVFATQARAALAHLALGRVDVVVADILMPEMTGLELLEQAAAAGFFQPFIFVTALQSRDAAIQALRLGAFDFLEKPLTTAAIEAPVRKALRVGAAYRRLEAETDARLLHSPEDRLRVAAREVLGMRAMRHQKG